MKRKCPVCGEIIDIPDVRWVLSECESNGHAVASINNKLQNVSSHIRNAAFSQVNANLSAHDFDYDEVLNLGFVGTAWVQCPKRRGHIGTICWGNGRRSDLLNGARWWVS